MLDFRPNDYGPVFASLLEIDRIRPLDEGTGTQGTGPKEIDYAEMRDQLAKLTLVDAFAHASLVDDAMARCCLSGIWLLYDFLDESHTISQNIATAEGSFWHGIMHRREGDFGNAKYWFRKVGEHPVFTQIDENWDPFDFVDACQSALGSGGPEESRCQQLQRQEWEGLFDHCYRQAAN